jgi:phosphatidate phosphatase APP1
MTKKSKFLLTIIYDIKLFLSRAILWLTTKLGLLRAVIIVPYNGYGFGNEIFMVGRVLKNNSVTKSTPEDSVWSNVKKMIRRFRTVVIPGVQVKATVEGQEFFAVTNEEGYFEFRICLENAVQAKAEWITIPLVLTDQVVRRQKLVQANAPVYIPLPGVEYGVISDIDDTIIPTGAMRLGEMLKTTFAKNAHARIPFPGVTSLYSALRTGADGVENNPFFYVSSSPWNLYDFLLELLDIHLIPIGPLMLRDIGLSRTELISGDHEEHKLEQIRKILTVYSSLQFMLIGDSGQEDPEIYLKVVKEFPGRILIVFIRDIHDSRHEFVMEKQAEMKVLGVEMILIKDTEEARNYSISKGWISGSEA